MIEEIEPRSSNADPDDHADGKSAGGLNVEANGDGDVSMDVSQAEVQFDMPRGTSPELSLTEIGTHGFHATSTVRHRRDVTATPRWASCRQRATGYVRDRWVSGLSKPDPVPRTTFCQGETF